MSLVQAYRAEIAGRQTHRFLAYLALAVGLHILAAATLLIWHPRLLNPKASESPMPLDFVYVEPQKSVTPPKSPSRQAQTNSTASQRRDPNRPIQTASRPNFPATSSAASSPASSPAASSSVTQLQTEPVVSAPRPTPAAVRPIARPATPPVNSSSNSTVLTAPSPDPSWKLPPNSPVTHSPVTPPRSHPPTIRPATAGSGSAPSVAAQLGNPSVSVESGATAQLNPDQLSTGSGVDAVQNDLWGGYLAALNRTVERNWRQVSVTATSRTRVQFRVNRQGEITSLQLLEASGNTLADQAAIQAVRAAAPFAPLPANATEDTLIVNFTFTQWLNPDSP